MTTFKTLAFLLCLGLASFTVAGERLDSSTSAAAEEEEFFVGETQLPGGIITPKGEGGIVRDIIVPGCFPLIIGAGQAGVTGVQLCPPPREPERDEP